MPNILSRPPSSGKCPQDSNAVVVLHSSGSPFRLLDVMCLDDFRYCGSQNASSSTSSVSVAGLLWEGTKLPHLVLANAYYSFELQYRPRSFSYALPDTVRNRNWADAGHMLKIPFSQHVLSYCYLSVILVLMEVFYSVFGRKTDLT